MSALRRGAGALVALLFTAALVALPPYRARIRPGVNQVLALPRRLGTSLQDMSGGALGMPWTVAESIRRRTFDDAIIVISDDPRDRELASLLWMAYYDYPRVLVQRATLRARPDLKPDFLLVTRNFPPDMSPEARGDEPGLIALSERAKRFIRGEAP